jgi:hypothetical protein
MLSVPSSAHPLGGATRPLADGLLVDLGLGIVGRLGRGLAEGGQELASQRDRVWLAHAPRLRLVASLQRNAASASAYSS